MTGPGGTSTKRDQRRDSRRAQFQQRQLERQRERQRRMRQQQLRRGGFAGAGVLVIILLALSLFVWHPWLSSSHPSTWSTSTETASRRPGRAIRGTSSLAPTKRSSCSTTARRCSPRPSPSGSRTNSTQIALPPLHVVERGYFVAGEAYGSAGAAYRPWHILYFLPLPQ